MLQTIRNKSKGYVMWIIILLISVIFILTGISYFFVTTNLSSNSVATVGNLQIPQSNYQQALINSREKLSNNEILEQLIYQSLLQQDAIASNIRITNYAISNSIFQNSIFMENGKYSENKFNEFAKLHGGSNNIKSFVAKELLTSSIITPLTQSQFSLINEKNLLNSLLEQKREISYYYFPIEYYTDVINPTYEELHTYYDVHKDKYAQDKQVIILYSNISIKDLISEEPIPEHEITHYYQINRNMFLISENRERKIYDLNENLKNGEVIEEKFMTLDESRATIEKILKNRIALDKLNQILTRIDNGEFDTVVKINNIQTKISNPFQKGTVGIGIEANKQLQELIFNHNQQQGFVATSQTEAIIFKIEKIIPKNIPNMDQIKDRVKLDYIDEKSHILAEEHAKKVLINLQENKQVENLQERSRKIGRNDLTLNAEFKKAIFSDTLEEYKLSKTKDAYWVYKVLATIDVDGKINKLSNELLQDINNNMELNDYLIALSEQYPVKINQQLT